MKWILHILLIVLIGHGANMAGAAVNPKNGNFYIGYKDFVFSNSVMKLNITRTYNSKIADAGWFGVGWGSDYETYLITVPGGGLLIFNNGSGKRDIQKPKEWNMQDISMAIDELTDAMRSEGRLKTPDEVTAMKSKLLNDQELRHTYWRKYLRKGMVKNRVVAAGTKLYSSCGCGGFEFIIATADGFKRSNSNGNTEYFNLDGKLVKIEDQNGNGLQFEFNDSLFIKKITDNNGNELHIDVNAAGRILSITDQNKRSAIYKYDGYNNLIYSMDINGNIYRFDYDGNSNMTAIHYMDNSSMTIAYNKSGYATKVTERDSNSTEYQYPFVSDLEYGSVIIKRNKKDSILRKESIWYNLKTDAIGTSWVCRIAQVINDTDSSVQIFNEAHHRTDTLLKNGGLYKFYYDIKGNLVKVCDRTGNCAATGTEQNMITTLTTAAGTYQIIYEQKNTPKSLITPSGTRFECPVKIELPEQKIALNEFALWAGILEYTYLSDNIDNILPR